MPSCVLSDRIQNRLLLRSLQLDKILINKDIIKLRARGYCMYPSILPGDILHARYKEFQEINNGEVVIFRREGMLFAHRIIRKHENGINSGLVTQADRSLSEDGVLVPVHDILGVLVAIERRNRMIDFDRKPLKLQSKLFFNILLITDALKSKIKPCFSKFLRVLSERQIYFFVSQLLFPLSRKQLEFLFSVPFSLGKMGEFYKLVSFDDLATYCRQVSKSQDIYFKVSIKEKNSFIANAVFSREPYGNEYGYRICSLRFRIRYSSPLVVAILIKKTNEILGGMSNLYFFVRNSDEVLSLHRPLFLKSGFVKKGDYLEFNPITQ